MLGRAEEPGVRYGTRWQVMDVLIRWAWMQAEAFRRSVVVTDEAVDQAFDERKAAGYPTEADYQAHLQRSGMTDADLKWRVRMDLLASPADRHRLTRTGRVARAGGRPAWWLSRREARS